MRRSAAVLVVSLSACLGDVGEPRSPATPGAQVTELRSAPGRVPRAGRYADGCSEAIDCRSRVCLHVDQASRLGGRVCSRRCGEGHDECERGRCVQAFPADDGWFCVPEARP